MTRPSTKLQSDDSGRRIAAEKMWRWWSVECSGTWHRIGLSPTGRLCFPDHPEGTAVLAALGAFGLASECGCARVLESYRCRSLAGMIFRGNSPLAARYRRPPKQDTGPPRSLLLRLEARIQAAVQQAFQVCGYVPSKSRQWQGAASVRPRVRVFKPSGFRVATCHADLHHNKASCGGCNWRTLSVEWSVSFSVGTDWLSRVYHPGLAVGQLAGGDRALVLWVGPTGESPRPCVYARLARGGLVPTEGFIVPSRDGKLPQILPSARAARAALRAAASPTG